MKKDLRPKTPKITGNLNYASNKKEIKDSKNNSKKLLNTSNIRKNKSKEKSQNNRSNQKKNKSQKKNYEKEKDDNDIYIKAEKEEKIKHKKTLTNKIITNFSSINIGFKNLFLKKSNNDINKSIFLISEENNEEKYKISINTDTDNNTIDCDNKNLNINGLFSRRNNRKNINHNELRKNNNTNNKCDNKTKYIAVKNKNINVDKDKLHPYLQLFNQSNLFNSSLLILCNILCIKKNVTKKEYNIEKEYSQMNKPLLTYISLNIIKYLNYYYNNNNKNIIKNEYTFFLSLYNNYIEWFSKKYCKESELSKALKKKDNLESIITNIYENINNEFTKMNPPINNKKLKYNNNEEYSMYKHQFDKNNNSVIFSHFTGTYQKIIQCQNCDTKKYEYISFCHILFKKIENNINDINFYSCLNNLYNKNNKNNLYCKNCLKKGIKEKFSIFSCPKILTILLTDFENCNFSLEDELDLKQYVDNNSDQKNESVYRLISILYQFKHNNKYRTYFINIYDGSWYYYEDNQITQVEIIDINTNPLMLIYESKDMISSNYKSIKRDNLEKSANILLKQQVETLEKQLKEEKEKNFDNINNLNRKQKELDELNKNYISLKNELSRYPINLLVNEKLISIIFLSSDESIEHTIICKNTDYFSRLEKLFYNKYPEFKSKISDFYVNGKKIDRKKNLKENKIDNGDKLLFNI